MWQVSFPVLRFFPFNIIPPLLHTHSLICCRSRVMSAIYSVVKQSTHAQSTRYAYVDRLPSSEYQFCSQNAISYISYQPISQFEFQWLAPDEPTTVTFRWVQTLYSFHCCNQKHCDTSQASLSSRLWTRQLSRDVPVDAGLLCDKAAVLGDSIKGTLFVC